MSNYNKCLEKALYYASKEEIKAYVKEHSKNGILHSSNGSEPVLADMLEEADMHDDDRTLHELRNHKPPFAVVKVGNHINVRSKLPVYKLMSFVHDSTDADEFKDYLHTPETRQRLVDLLLSSDVHNRELNPPERATSRRGFHNPYISESVGMGRGTKAYQIGEHLLSHETDDDLQIIGLEHVKHVSPEEYKQIKKDTEQRYR
jgi:hypothetical protein